MLFGDYVLNVESCKWRIVLMQLAIFATLARVFSDRRSCGLLHELQGA